MTIGERLRGILLENWNLKLVSFAFAIVLYSLVHGGQDAKRSIIIDLEALLPPESSNRVLVTSLPRTVRLEVKGTNPDGSTTGAKTWSTTFDVARKVVPHLMEATGDTPERWRVIGFPLDTELDEMAAQGKLPD